MSILIFCTFLGGRLCAICRMGALSRVGMLCDQHKCDGNERTDSSYLCLCKEKLTSDFFLCYIKSGKNCIKQMLRIRIPAALQKRLVSFCFLLCRWWGGTPFFIHHKAGGYLLLPGTPSAYLLIIVRRDNTGTGCLGARFQKFFLFHKTAFLVSGTVLYKQKKRT